MEQTTSKSDSNGGPEKTLKEVIHEDQADARDAHWKSLKDVLRLHHAGTAWAAAVAGAANTRPRNLSRTTSVRSPQKHPPWGDEQDEAVAALLQRPPANDETKKTSLKALLAEGGEYSDDEEGDGEPVGREDEDEDEEYEEVRGSEGMGRTCCVCNVRHKGKALIPCGHTLCRLCSRELRVSPENCPLCDEFVLEILDVF